MRLLVNGSGPAGIAAAIMAADYGIETTLLCKQLVYFSREKEPLQSVHPGLESLLKYIGCEEAITSSSRSVYEGIWSCGAYSPLSTVAGETWYGHHISRQLFDGFLLDVARRKNIEVANGGKIQGMETGLAGIAVKLNTGTTYDADYLIDASGRSRILGKFMGLKETYHSPQISAYSGVASGLDGAFFERNATSFLPDKMGWTWLAPEPPERCTWTSLAITGDSGIKIPPVFAAGEADTHFIRSANMRWRVFRPLVKDRVILTGDAAGILDPGAGQGILNACYSGIMAARSLISIASGEMNAEAALTWYDEWFMSNYLQKVSRLKEYYKNLDIIF